MNDLLIPNWHPLLVHFTVALIVTSSVFFVLSRFMAKRETTFITVAKWTLWAGAGVTIFTVVAGFDAYNTVNHDDAGHAVMKVHRLWALITFGATLVVAFWVYKAKSISAAIVVASVILTGLAGTTGYFGAELVYSHGIGVMRVPLANGEGHAHAEGDSHSHGATAPQSDDGADTHDHEADVVASGENVKKAGAHGHEDPESVAASDDHSHAGTSALDFAKHFQDALFSGDFNGVAQRFAPDAVIFENGVKETSLAGYLEHHLKPEMPMLQAAKRQVLKQNVREVGEMAIVTTASTLSLSSKGKRHDFYSVETLGLVAEGADWKVAHVHWSSRPIQKQ